MRNKGDTPEMLKKFGIAMSLGTMFVSYVAAGGIVGYFLQKWLGIGEWVFILCFMLGIAGAIYHLFKAAARLN
jgi:F0F1-type ATP synthase assembly protein I